MDFRTPFLFLLGRREAILQVAGTRASFWVGALFVLSAGFAREYDGEYLWLEPWHVLRPLAASLITGSVLFLMLEVVLRVRAWYYRWQGLPSIFTNWYRFQSLFWWTAPLAWLYAIPYERFLDPVQAVKVNLFTLGVVACWRVGLIARAASVLHGIGYRRALWVTLLFSDAVLLLAMSYIPGPTLDVMGGLRYGERDAILASVRFNLSVLGLLTLPVWLLCSLSSFFFAEPRREISFPSDTGPGSAFHVALAVLLIWIPFLPATQHEQRHRHEVEAMLARGDVAEALRHMSARSPDDFPLAGIHHRVRASLTKA